MTVYAEVQGSTLIQYPYTLQSLMDENPYTNFGPDPDIAAIFPETNTAITMGYILQPVVFLPKPAYDPATQICTQNNQPTLESNIWTLGWTIAQMTPEQQAAWQNQQKAINKSQAQQLLSATDWTQIPGTSDPSNNPYLTNPTEFNAYRASLRAIAVNPPVTATWPIKPTEQWSS